MDRGVPISMWDYGWVFSNIGSHVSRSVWHCPMPNANQWHAWWSWWLQESCQPYCVQDRSALLASNLCLCVPETTPDTDLPKTPALSFVLEAISARSKLLSHRPIPPGHLLFHLYTPTTQLRPLPKENAQTSFMWDRISWLAVAFPGLCLDHGWHPRIHPPEFPMAFVRLCPELLHDRIGKQGGKW